MSENEKEKQAGEEVERPLCRFSELWYCVEAERNGGNVLEIKLEICNICARMKQAGASEKAFRMQMEMMKTPDKIVLPNLKIHK